MKKLVFIFVSLLFLTACGQTIENNQETGYMNITASEAKEIMPETRIVTKKIVTTQRIVLLRSLFAALGSDLDTCPILLKFNY